MIVVTFGARFLAALSRLCSASMAHILARAVAKYYVQVPSPMHIADAAHKTVLDYPGGSVALATRLISTNDRGEEKPMSAAVLRSKVNPNTRTHHLTLTEASEIMGLTGDHRILHALAAEHGYTVVLTDVPEAGSLVAALIDAGEIKGKLCQIIGDALDDGRITANEALAIGGICGDLQAIAAQIARHASAAVDRARAAA